MTDRNVDKRLFLPLYLELLQKLFEVRWVAQDLGRTNTFWGDTPLEETEEQGRKMAAACLPALGTVERMLRLLVTPENREINSFVRENGMEEDVLLLTGLRSLLEQGAGYRELDTAADRYAEKIFDRLQALYCLPKEDDTPHFGENLTFDFPDASVGVD